jgi:Family of unknown function (DUF5954)
MADPRDHVPAYQSVRMTAPEAPVAAMADTEAWQARSAYPQLRFAGGPAFGAAREREEGGWQLHPWFGVLTPQDARDTLGSHFRRRAAEAEKAGDGKAARKWLGAAGRMDREAVDDVTVLGIGFRIVRADKFIRTGPLGPEPPRPADADPGKPGWASDAADPAAGFVIDPAVATGLSEGIVKLELLEAIRAQGTVPGDVREDAARAAHTHPGGVLLPPAFVAAELSRGQWGPVHLETSPTPQGARDHLASYLRVTAPWQLKLDPGQRAAYDEAANQLDERGDELSVAGRRFRIVRVERLVRVGPDGPEGPRPSDPDPQPPVLAGGLPAPGSTPEEDAPAELDEDGQRFLALFHEEEERRRARYGDRGDPPVPGA